MLHTKQALYQNFILQKRTNKKYIHDKYDHFNSIHTVRVVYKTNLFGKKAAICETVSYCTVRLQSTITGTINKFECIINFHRAVYPIDAAAFSFSLYIPTHIRVKSQGKCPGNQPSCFPCIDQEELGEGLQAFAPHPALLHLILLPRQCSTSTAILFQLKTPSPACFPSFHLTPFHYISY